jgi:hypothetical protein
MMYGICSFETSVITRATRHDILEDSILQVHYYLEETCLLESVNNTFNEHDIIREGWCLLGCYAVWLL